MADQNRFDIIIAGAGAAGLSLLWRIMNSTTLRNQKVLLIDQSFKPVNDKIWCFWEDLQIPPDDLIRHSWKKLLVRFREETYSEPLKKFQYQCLRNDDFSEYILQEAKNRLQVTFLKADIKNFTPVNQYGCVHTSGGDFESKRIFQSVLKPTGFDNLKVDISLIQHFLGWEININQSLFDPNMPTFMDFDVPQKDGPSFIYLLPFSKTKALVEYTIFSNNLMEKDQYREQIKNYVTDRFDVQKKDYSVEREEFGVIPMEDREYPAKFCDFVWNIGTVGGFAKPSTGYTFSRIQKHTSEIIEALESGRDIPKFRASSHRFRVYDLMMLYLLQHEKDNALKVFENLFKKNDFDDILQFLAEETTPIQEWIIFSKMPYKPFLRSVFKMKHRIFWV